MIKILHIVSSLNGGGVEAMLLNYYDRMNHDEVKFDFITHGSEIGILEGKFTDLHSKIYHVTPKHTSLLKNLKETYNIIKKGNYDIVHCHQGPKGIFALIFAKIIRVKIRIIHNHIAFVPETKIERTKRKIICWITKALATHHFACGSDASEWAYGKNALNEGKARVINNAIDTSRFVFDSKIRESIRKELCVGNKSVIGCVARFSHQKNHKFLIDIFAQVRKMNPDTVLWLIGEGPLINDIKEHVNQLGLTDTVLFLGARNDVEMLFQGMDLFLLPTKFEGLGIVYIEAQAAGLKTIASKYVVPRETKVTDLISYVDLDAPIEHWVNKVLEGLTYYERKNTSKEIMVHGYEINKESQKLKNIYLQLVTGQ